MCIIFFNLFLILTYCIALFYSRFLKLLHNHLFHRLTDFYACIYAIFWTHMRYLLEWLKIQFYVVKKKETYKNAPLPLNVHSNQLLEICSKFIPSQDLYTRFFLWSQQSTSQITKHRLEIKHTMEHTPSNGSKWWAKTFISSTLRQPEASVYIWPFAEV